MYIDHVGINTNDMEATLQFYCGILGMRLVRTTRTPDGRRHYNVEIGGGNAFAVFDGAELPTAGERQHVNHLHYQWTRLRNLTPSTTGSRTMESPWPKLSNGAMVRPSTSMIRTASGCKLN